MREKELRIALVCYGGISLAVYMHGVTKEVWRLAAASRDLHGGSGPGEASQRVYHELLAAIAGQGTALRVLVDILAGASAGGINAIFLAQAIATGRPLDPLTELWLESADVDKLIGPAGGALKRFAKSAAIPFAWALAARSGAIDATVEPGHRAEVRAKLASFVRARWFAPPFDGAVLTNLILDALDAMAREPAAPPLLPEYQPLDLFVTVTDFRGHPETLRLNSPPTVIEREHRITLAFHDPPGPERGLGEAAGLAFAARATASFPGAFPVFTVKELDQVLEKRELKWAGRDAFLARALPGRNGPGEAERAVLIDGSVLANAPFEPAIAALEGRPARREVDRRFVYIDPKPGVKSVRLTGRGPDEPPGFLATVFGALSDLPREQPIRDNLEAIERRSGRIRRMRRIVAAMRPEVEAEIEAALGSTFLLSRPTAKRLAAWRSRANTLAARSAGFAFAAYAHLKIAAVTEEAAETIARLGGADREQVREAVWGAVRARGLVDSAALTAGGASPVVVQFLRELDTGFRIRRLRFLTRRAIDLLSDRDAAQRVRTRLIAIDQAYRSLFAAHASVDRPRFAFAVRDPDEALAALAARWDLKGLDAHADAELAFLLDGLAKGDRRRLALAYLGFPYFDLVMLPLLQGEGLDEFDPIKVDRISPDDAVAIRAGGTAATLKGIQLNSFGAFFSRAYRENDYLWGRLHGADRLIDIIVSTQDAAERLPDAQVKAFKRAAFRAILAEEKPLLSRVQDLIESLEREVG